ncbi:MAG: NFACT family protein, partial [Lachnospiraceae bacterium]|nr:NFACT family protein [Lachnospiraceae bacterium]
MAFDGVTVAAIVKELNDKLIDGRINKVAQPEKDELLLTIKAGNEQLRLILSANPTLPLVYLTDENKISPATAPSFTMLLRKHLQGGRIVSIYQPDFERIIVMEVEHLDEMGDLCRKRLITELMGKYSNIILTDDKDTILDSIRRVSALTSSVREVLPGLDYFVPKQEGKRDPLKVSETEFTGIISGAADSNDDSKAIASGFTGISTMMAHEICAFAEGSNESLWGAFNSVMSRVKNGDFSPEILYENGEPKDYCAVPVATYAAENTKEYDSISLLLRDFY